jgi:hypothetical protein
MTYDRDGEPRTMDDGDARREASGVGLLALEGELDLTCTAEMFEQADDVETALTRLTA